MRNFWKHNELLPIAVNLWNLMSLIPLVSLLKGSYVPTKVGLFLVHGSNWRALWKNRICSTAMKLRKSLVKTVMWQTPCNYIELFGSSARDRHVWRMLFSERPPIYASYMTTSGGRTKQLYNCRFSAASLALRVIFVRRKHPPIYASCVTISGGWTTTH